MGDTIMGADFTTVSAAIKEHYAKNVAKVLFDAPEVTPLLGLIEKRSGKVDAGGQHFNQPIQYSDGTSVSATFSTAQDKAQSTTTGGGNAYANWAVPAITINAVAYWNRQIIDQIQGDSAFFDLAEAEMTSKMRLIRIDVAKHLAGSGFGDLAAIRGISSATPSVTVGTDKVQRFTVGMDLVAASAVGTATLRSTTSSAISAIDPDTGIMTMDADIVSTLSWASSSAAGDYLFAKGDRQNSATATPLKIYGFGGWLPNSAPGTTTWCGVNRSGVWQLGGLRYNAHGITMKTALITAANRLYQFGATKVTHAFCSVADYATVADALDTAARTMKVDAKRFSVSWEAIEILGANTGPFPLLADPWIAAQEVIMGDFNNPDNCYLIYSGDLVNIDDHDGNIFLRAASATAYEARMYMYGNLVVGAPGRFLKIYNWGN
jgi:hypothetical protein